MNRALRRSAAHVFVPDAASPVLSVEDSHHLSGVLRLRAGEPVTCADGRGAWRECAWTGSGLDPRGPVELAAAPSPSITVAISPVKGDRTDMVVEKLVEIGVDRIVVLAPLARSVVRWDPERAASAMARLGRIARAAAMQSRRVHLPVIAGPVPLADVCLAGAAIAEPGGGVPPERVTTLVVGPEGGFAPEELALAPALVDLGPTVLRAETAAIAGAVRMVAHRTVSLGHTG